jgi:hypothetical protein
MVDERSIVALLYRADWRRLSLTGAVRGGGPPLLSVLTEQRRPRPGEPFPPPPPFRPPSGSPGETDMTLLVAPGGRYRVAVQDGTVWGCDGERAWAWFGELPPGREISLSGGPEPPFPELLEPSWLVAGYDLTVEGDTTACGRPVIRVAASARMTGRERRETGGLPFRWPPVIRADRVTAVVDAELGILLRCEFQRDGESRRGERTPDVAEFRSLTVDPETDPARFTAPAGSVFADTSGSWPWPSGFPFGAAGREVAKTAAGLAAAGLGAAIRYTPRKRPDPFARATEEAADPDAAMPRDDGGAPDETPGPDEAPGSAAPPVGDEVLHLLYRSGADEPRFTAVLHQWVDPAALLDAVPESARKTGFGGVGLLVDAVRDAAALDSTIHLVSSVRIGGWDRYRIDAVYPPAGESSPQRGWHPHRPSPLTDACDGQRRWQVFADRVEVGDAAPLPEEIACLADGSWLLGGQLSGGEEVTVGGRRAYRVAGRVRYRTPFRLLSVLSMDSFPAVAAVDAESGRPVRVTRYVGGKPMWCCELRDIGPDTSADFGFEPPAGLRVVDEKPPEQPNPADFTAKAAMDAVRGFLGSFRRTGG